MPFSVIATSLKLAHSKGKTGAMTKRIPKIGIIQLIGNFHCFYLTILLLTKDMKKVIAQWMEQSSYDLKTAEAMHDTKRYLYVAFMCQQAIEKHLKAVICQRSNKMPPYIHNLTALSEQIGINLSEDQLDFLDILSRHYLTGRYPMIKQELAKSLNQKESSLLIANTKVFLKWLAKESKI